MDKIYIEDLRVDTIIGIYDWERRTRQVISLDIEMAANITLAAVSDSVTDTINYKKVAKRLISYITNSEFLLIETLIERVSQIILYEFDVQQVKLRLSKPGAVRYSRNVGIEISRERSVGQAEAVFISIGSNVAPKANIQSALATLRDEFVDIRLSPVYQNPAVGFDGDDFLNLVVGVETALPPEHIAGILNRIETTHGRDKERAKFSARTLDLDLLLYGEKVVVQQGLNLPRDDITRYAFVLKPLVQLAPELVHPIENKTLAELWQGFEDNREMQQVDIEQAEVVD